MPPEHSRRDRDLPRYVERTRAKGRTYLYFRHRGTRWPLPADTTSSAFHEAYAARLRAIETDPAPRQVGAGTVGALVRDFKSSESYLALAPKTRRDYARMLDRLAPVDDVPAEHIRRAHVRELAADLQDTPRTHRLFTQVVSALFSFGIDNDYVIANPAARMKRIGKAESYLPWSDEDCATFEAGAPPAWMMTAYRLARYSGQRLGDVITMTWRAYDGDRIEVQQAKTGEPLRIKAHSALREHLDGIDRTTLLIVTMPDGRAWKDTTASKYFNRWLDGAGLGHLNFHGLRHTAGRALAEAGCSTHEIQAVLGHRTLAMVENYTKRARQQRLAATAIAKLERDGGER